MPIETNVLYLSYDGMTDQLGQSQVIPYLEGLSKEGYRFTLISFEKPDRFEKFSKNISERVKNSGIDWIPLPYTKRPPVLSTIWDIWQMKRKAYRFHKERRFSIVHCRSYLTSLVGLKMKRKFGVKFIFDMRAFYADERVDGKIWNLSNPAYKIIYNFFKRKEKEFLEKADYVITLTEKAKEIIHTWKDISGQPVSIQVIPCCSDLELFSPESVSEDMIKAVRNKFQLTGNEFVLSYLGSVGTWYMLDEMLDFFKYLKREIPSARFFFITNDSPENIIEKAIAKEIPADSLIIYAAKREEVPALLSVSNYSIFFIQPFFSKAGSSPTKQGEIMGMGIPQICNAGVGDVDTIVSDSAGGILIQEFTGVDYLKAVKQTGIAAWNKEKIRAGAEKCYSLKKGIEKYLFVYRQVTQ